MDVEIFRHALRQYLTGVTIITSANAISSHGMTCNSFTSVSLNPASVLICLTKGSRTEQLILETGFFAVNILKAHQKDISVKFSRQLGDCLNESKFESISWHKSPLGCPIILGALAVIDCKVVKTVECYDHTIFIANALSATIEEDADASPLGYFQSAYISVRDLG